MLFYICQSTEGNAGPRIVRAYPGTSAYLANRSKEDMLISLVKWAHDATQQSYNKPALPHLIIAYRKLDDSSQSEVYDVDTATENLLEKLNINDMPKLTKFIDYWQGKDEVEGVGKAKVDSAQALLEFYYASVSVVNFPGQDEPTRMHTQTETLYRQIVEKRKQSQDHRANVWMRMNAATFPLYVRKAFAHFSSNFQEPFDFYEAWFKLHPVSFKFDGAIFALAKQVRDLGKLDGMELWEKISGFVASCLLLNHVRNELPGGTAIHSWAYGIR